MKVTIKTMNGKPQREVFTAFEINALKEAVMQGVKVGQKFSFGNDGEVFEVRNNEPERLVILREKTGQLLCAKYTADEQQGDPAPAPEKVQVQPQTGAANELQLLQGLRALLGSGVQIDETKVRQIVADEVARLKPSVTQIVVNDVPQIEIKGVTHPVMPKIMFNIKNNIDTYLVGGAGTGKTFAAKQAADALGLKFYANSALQDKSELVGYTDVNGNYIETDFYKAFTNGGVFLLDEIDATSAEVLVPFNMAIANRVFSFPSKGLVSAHENFRIIAAANTSGQGRTNLYNGRFKLDASTLNRFAFIKLEYSREIELQMAGDDAELVDFVREIRAKIERLQLTYTATPRDIKRVATYVRGGYSIIESLELGMFGGWNVQDLATMKNAANLQGNKYYAEFMKLKTC